MHGGATNNNCSRDSLEVGVSCLPSVRWPSVIAARSHYYQMHHGAPTLNDIDFGAGTPTPKRQCRKINDFHFELTYTGSAGPYLCSVSGCERDSNGYSQFKNLKAEKSAEANAAPTLKSARHTTQRADSEREKVTEAAVPATEQPSLTTKHSTALQHATSETTEGVLEEAPMAFTHRGPSVSNLLETMQNVTCTCCLVIKTNSL